MFGGLLGKSLTVKTWPEEHDHKNMDPGIFAIILHYVVGIGRVTYSRLWMATAPGLLPSLGLEPSAMVTNHE